MKFRPFRPYDLLMRECAAGARRLNDLELPGVRAAEAVDDLPMRPSSHPEVGRSFTARPNYLDSTRWPSRA